jgi:deoxyribodipyrimidine photo-lyase
MIASRRTRSNFALERAVELANEHRKPLLVLEGLQCDYPWASDRLHRFILDGMENNAAACARADVLYYPYVERRPSEGSRLLDVLGARAVSVVSDDFPDFRLSRAVAAAAQRLPVRLEVVDSNGLLPLSEADRAYPTAHSFRRHLQSTLPWSLDPLPVTEPLKLLRNRKPPKLPSEARIWGPTPLADLSPSSKLLASLPIDHGVVPADIRGGSQRARKTLRRFLDHRLGRYADERNDPVAEATSGLSPYLHFGHISSHEVFSRLASQEGWSPEKLGVEATGARSGWWGMSASAESFLDELVTWRELGFNFCRMREDYGRYESLPNWARVTLEKHVRDLRPWIYDLSRLEAADTHDPLWNAAQRQLVQEGRIAGYLRMLWGKKILEWTLSPREALEVMLELNNRYALDGRDPNSYSGIFWVLGRYDRPWGPERPIFGKVRYMSSENAKRKLRLGPYLDQFSGHPGAPNRREK